MAQFYFFFKKKNRARRVSKWEVSAECAIYKLTRQTTMPQRRHGETRSRAHRPCLATSDLFWDSEWERSSSETPWSTGKSSLVQWRVEARRVVRYCRRTKRTWRQVRARLSSVLRSMLAAMAMTMLVKGGGKVSGKCGRYSEAGIVDVRIAAKCLCNGAQEYRRRGGRSGRGKGRDVIPRRTLVEVDKKDHCTDRCRNSREKMYSNKKI